MSSSPTTLVFVYGTLKRGQCRAFALVGQTWLGPARTAPRYRMLSCGTYPALVPAAAGAEHGTEIEGELYEVDARCLAELDRIEGVAENWFRRERIELSAPELERPVVAYFFAGDTAGLPDCGSCW